MSGVSFLGNVQKKRSCDTFPLLLFHEQCPEETTGTLHCLNWTILTVCNDYHPLEYVISLLEVNPYTYLKLGLIQRKKVIYTDFTFPSQTWIILILNNTINFFGKPWFSVGVG